MGRDSRLRGRAVIGARCAPRMEAGFPPTRASRHSAPPCPPLSYNPARDAYLRRASGGARPRGGARVGARRTAADARARPRIAGALRDGVRPRGAAPLHAILDARPRLRRRPRLPRRVSLHARRLPHDVPRPPVDAPPNRRIRNRPRHQRALQVSPRAWADRPLDGLRPSDAHGLRLAAPARRGRGREARRRHRHRPRYVRPVRRHPHRQGQRVPHDQPPGHCPAEFSARARGAGGSRVGVAAGHRAKRLAQGVSRAEDVRASASRRLPDDDGRRRVLHAQRPQLEHDLHIRLPHPRGGLDGGAGGGLHARAGDGLRGGRNAARPLARRVRPAPFVLLRRAHGLLRGGRQTARRPPPLGADYERALRRDRPARDALPLSLANARLHAHPRGAAQQSDPRLDAGAGRRARRNAVAARQRLRRGARHSVGGRDADVAQHAADHRRRDGRRQHGGPARRRLPHRAPHERDRGGGARLHQRH